MQDTNMVKSLLLTMHYPLDRVEDAVNVLHGSESGDLLSPSELCQVLKISPTTLWRLNLPYIKVGHRKRYVLKEVMESL